MLKKIKLKSKVAWKQVDLLMFIKFLIGSIRAC